MIDFTNRTPSDFAFRAIIEGNMFTWQEIKQTEFNINMGDDNRPLIYMVFTDPDIKLMQMTPWRDNQGNIIYEGDILEFDSKEWGCDCRFVMEWDRHDFSHPGVHSDLSEWCTVIGNVHENPELIKTLTN